MTDFNRIKLNIPRTPSGLTISNVIERYEKRPLFVPAIMLFLSCFMTYKAGTLFPLSLSIPLLVALGIYGVRKRNTECAFCAVLTVILVLFCCYRIYSALNVVSPYDSKADVTGTVISCEKKLSGTSRITAKIEGLDSELKFTKDFVPPELMPGCVFTAYGSFREPLSAGNPGEFDYKDYLKSRGIRYQFYADTLTVTKEPSGFRRSIFSFPDLCFSLRSRILNRFTFGRSKEEKGLIAAVCLGDSSLADDNAIRDFRLSGCSHLLAVSGTHFAGFLAVLPYLLGLLCPDRKKSSLIYGIFVFIIGCITGWSESVTRAAFMSSCAFTGKDNVSALSASALVMIAADPFCSARTGFLLSFSACISIRLLSGRIMDFLSFMKEKRGLAMAISAQTAAIIGMMPFSGMINCRFSLVQFIVQAIGGFFAKGTCMMFVPGVVLSWLFPSESASYVSSPSFLFLSILRNSVGIGSELSLGPAAGKPIEPGYVLCFWLFVFLLLMPRFAFKKILFKASCGLMAVLSGFVIADIIRPLKAELVFADVGQGDCCLIIAGNKTCLIDGGTYEEGDSAVSDLLDYYGIDSVDMAFMTHWDQDHAGGIAALNRKGRIKSIYSGFTGVDGDTEAFEKSLFIRNCDTKDFRNRLIQTKGGDVFELSDSVRLNVIYPIDEFSGGNPGSLVILMECNGKRILFTGDIGFESEEKLVSGNLIGDVDILKVSHHGSKYASSKEFLIKTLPDISIISAGRNNLYGHPAPATLFRLMNVGSRIYRIDQEGAVILEFT